MLPAIPILRPDCLSVAVPSGTWGGGPIVAPGETLITFRSRSLDSSLRGATLAFFTDDWRFDAVWRHPTKYARQFVSCGFAGICEPDFSCWINDNRDGQYRAVFKMRLMGRIFQGYGLPVIPTLTWSNQESFDFCFRGIPRGCPVAACESVTAGQNDEDQMRFIAGLKEAVAQVEPKVILIYAGTSHEKWLIPALPAGPHYVMLDSFSRARAAWRKQEAQRNQLRLFEKEAA